MDRVRVPLVEFYKNLLPAARKRGYKLLLTALVREADSPSFYKEVKRYWSSLDDATGQNILFTFAGANAARQFDERGIKHERKRVVYYSDYMALARVEEKSPIRWQSSLFYHPRRESNSFPTPRRDNSCFDRATDFAVSHTLEVNDLRRFLGLSESQIPCLVFTLLKTNHPYDYPRLIAPFSVFKRMTVYQYLKRISEDLEKEFQAIDRLSESINSIKNLECNPKTNKLLHQISDLRQSVRAESRNMKMPEARDAVTRILNLTGTGNRSVEARSQCFSYLQIVRKNLELCHSQNRRFAHKYELFRMLERLIDVSFLDKARDFWFDEEDKYELRQDIRLPLSSLQKEEKEAWLKLGEALQKFCEPGEGVADGKDTPLDESKTRQILEFIAKLDVVSLPRYRVVGNCVRYDEGVRNQMKDMKQKIVNGINIHNDGQENYLIWGPPGSGKSHFVQQTAKYLGTAIRYWELNLTKLDEPSFKSKLAEIEKSDKPFLCFVDEADSKPLETWPYAALLTHLQPELPRKTRACFILAGSSGLDMSEIVKMFILAPKGVDLLDRLPATNRFAIPRLTGGDRILVTLCQLAEAAKGVGKEVREVEKLALLYFALNSSLSSARSIRDLAVYCVGQMPEGEDRIKYDNLFEAGDLGNKTFWNKWHGKGLDNSFVAIEDDQIQGSGRDGKLDQIYNQVARFVEKETRGDFAVETGHTGKSSNAQLFSKDDSQTYGFQRLAILLYKASTKSALEVLRKNFGRGEIRSKKNIASTYETSRTPWSDFSIQPDSKGALNDILRRYKGVLNDYALLKEKWVSALNVSGNSTLPGVSVLPKADSKIAHYSKIATECFNAVHDGRKKSAQRLIDISIMKYAIDRMARIVSFIKVGYSQRFENADQFNVSLLLAADTLARNYLGYLKMYGIQWDGFVTLTEHLEQHGYEFGRYTQLGQSFHLSLSSDVKYNTQEMIVLAHEIGHAVCETRVSLVKRRAQFFILDKALYYIFALRGKIAEIVENCCGTQSTLCRVFRGEPLRSFAGTDLADIFISEMSQSTLGWSIYEGLVDIVALHLAGSYYLNALMNYVYEPVVTRANHRTNKLKVNPNFFEALFRISICTAYAYKVLPREMRECSAKCFEECLFDNEAMLKNLFKKGNISTITYSGTCKCAKCVSEIGLLIGSRLAIFDREIFADLFVSKRSTVFSTDKNLIKAIKTGKEILNEEPRRILNAFCQIEQDSERTSSSSMIHSLALNRASYGPKPTSHSGRRMTG